MEMADAYGQPDFRKLTRTLTYNAGKVVLEDAFDPDYQSLKERFVTAFPPEIQDACVLVGGVKLGFDPEAVTCSVCEEVHALHGYRGETEKIYCIDFELQPGLKRVKFTMEIS